MGIKVIPSDVIEASELLLLPHSGRVVSDERGNNLWEWRRHDGTYSRELSAEDLEQLIAPLRKLQGGAVETRVASDYWCYQVQREDRLRRMA
ncbi:MAG: hypothetical protein QM718_14080 [Steroidobacteraceae bacterium]